MNKKIISALIIILVFLMVFIACTDMDPFGIANGVPAGFDPEGVPVTGVTLNKTTTSIIIGNTEQLTSTIEPEDATNKDTTWVSSDEGIATVGDNGLVTGISAGTATITVKSDTDDTIFAECEVTVVTDSIAVTGITLDQDTLTFVLGEAIQQLTATITPSDATDQTVTWASSDVNIATVSATGLVAFVTAVGVGTADITVTSDNDWIYFAETGGSTAGADSKIYKIKSDGTGSAVVAFTETTNGTPRAIQLDPIRRKIYILTTTLYVNNDDFIYEYDLDGGNPRELAFNDMENSISSMTVDHINGNLYYTVNIDGGSINDGIRKINLDGSITDTLVHNRDMANYQYICTDYKDPIGIYYLDKVPATEGDLFKVTGSNPEDRTSISHFEMDLDPKGLIYNMVNNLLYYYQSSSIYDTALGSFDTSANSINENIVIDQSEKIYFYDDSGGAGPYSLYRIETNGTNKTIILNTNPKRIGTFDILSK